LAPFGFKVFVNRILIEAGRRPPPTLNCVRDAAATTEDPGVDVVAGMRRDKDYGAIAFEQGSSSVSHRVTPAT
jgi:hypothetical protein